ncbi:hypothetical protein [Streptomyces sp. NPDC006193]|uniref:hypothetical protein n=1 Tax=Streptomyces sp. NPDC006193 TaxID=3155717 RepID=UPI0033BB2940
MARVDYAIRDAVNQESYQVSGMIKAARQHEKSVGEIFGGQAAIIAEVALTAVLAVA